MRGQGIVDLGEKQMMKFFRRIASLFRKPEPLIIGRRHDLKITPQPPLPINHGGRMAKPDPKFGVKRSEGPIFFEIDFANFEAALSFAQRQDRAADLHLRIASRQFAAAVLDALAEPA